MSHRKVGYAVIGLGHIAQHAVLPAFANAKNSQLVALVSSDGQKRRKLGKHYQVETYHDEAYDAVLSRPDVDAVYIAEPNDRHKDFVIRAAREGVHVLCEKPLGISEEECRRMIDACKEGGVLLMTAYRLHFEPSNLKAIQLIEQKKIGDLRYFTSTFGYQIRPGNIRTSAARGGGAIWDLGVYCINAARYLFRGDPVEVFAMQIERPGDERFAEVAEGMTVAMRFPGNRTAQFTVSFGSAAQGDWRIVGSKGSIELKNGYEYEGARELILTVGDETTRKTWKPTDQFGPELTAFSRAILTGAALEPTGEEGLRDVRIIVACLKSARENRPVRLSWPAPKRLPEPSDRIVAGRIRKGPLVHVEAPTLQ